MKKHLVRCKKGTKEGKEEGEKNSVEEYHVKLEIKTLYTVLDQIKNDGRHF